MRLLHGLILGLQLPVHGEREAEQAAWLPALLQDIVGVQVERGQPLQAGEEEQQQSTGDPATHDSLSTS